MTKIETAIITFNDWSKPYTFFKTVSEKLSGDDLILFQDIWQKANDPEVWSVHDIILSCKITQTFIVNNYGLEEHATTQIVRAITYDWK